MKAALVPSREVKDAIAGGRPVVALESTIVAHGLPWPENLEVGRALEQAVRAQGAVPATIAVVDGTLRVGLEAAELERLASKPGEFPKTGAADLAVRIARAQSGATTVSATAACAAMAGISVFSTGGIGGVHRGDAMDVSSDLTTLGRSPIAVVSAGCKAVLDLPRTLEALETLGVLVIGVGTEEFPAFYTRESGLALEHRVDDAAAAARVVRAHFDLGGPSGVLLANPIPAAAALDRGLIDGAIDHALSEAERRGLRGKAVTPFLLAELARSTGKASLAANRALALNNARFGADLAVALATLTKG
jgi:pseudouridine-5'-phosphate glycosidase